MVALSREPAPDELTVREAAREAHRGEETIRRWIWSGKLPARKLGNVYYIHHSDLRVALDEYSHSAKSHRPQSPRAKEEGELTLAEWLDEVRAWQQSLGPSRDFTDDDMVELIQQGRQEREDDIWEAFKRNDDH
jgi:excisionase family DNA binding protein